MMNVSGYGRSSNTGTGGKPAAMATTTAATGGHPRGRGHNELITAEAMQNRVMKSVTDYNRQLNQERKEDRRVCMDLQTYTIQYPVGLGHENRELRRWMRRRRTISPLWRDGRRYPVALLPNQYQDWYLRYTPQELKYFPLNTVLHGPIPANLDFESGDGGNKSSATFSPQQQPVPPGGQQQQPPSAIDSDHSNSDLDGSDVLSDLDDDSTCSCGEMHCSPSPSSRKDSTKMDKQGPLMAEGFDDENSRPPTLFQPTEAGIKPEQESSSVASPPVNGGRLCHKCKQYCDSQTGLFCADCGSVSHPHCLEISGELLQAIRLYRWQCQECKTCQQCGFPHDEEKMMFCDKCDRGYHTYCVGLTEIPQGHWVCVLCAVCANCGATKPASTMAGSSTETPSNGGGQWQHELIKIHSPDGSTMVRHSVFCETCYQSRKLPNPTKIQSLRLP